MAKLASIIVGVILFSLVATFMFKVAGDLGSEHGSEDAAKYSELSSNYDYLENVSTMQNSTQRSIWNKIKVGVLGETATAVVDAPVEGGKLLLGSLDNTLKVADTVAQDTEGFDGATIFLKAIKGILSTLFVLAVLFFLWRFKAET